MTTPSVGTARDADEPFAGLDATLVGEITGWKRGSPPPTRLLRFPDGRIDPPRCGMRAWGGAVCDYLSRITDTDLLQALAFDPWADDACFYASVRRLLEVRGVRDLRAVVAEKRLADPDAFVRPELATLVQLLTASYARIQVARLDKKDAARELADQVLRGLQSALVAGQPWAAAYRSAADQLLDTRRTQAEGGWRTFLCYAYDGLVAPTGFDLLDRRISSRLSPDHIQKIFEARGGAHRLETDDAWWLYHAEAFYE
jgi:hypothetical protein